MKSAQSAQMQKATSAESSGGSRMQAGPAQLPETATPVLTGLQRGLTGGAPLPMGLRSRMEAGYGTSLADVRVHTGAEAMQATGTLRAEALTSGNHIAFAPGRYRPGSASGDGLIAHELAHVIQQRHSGGGGAVQARSQVSNPGEAAEVSADRAAATVLSGGRAQVGAAGQSLRGQIMRRALPGTASLSLSPAMTLAPSRPGAVAPGAGSVLTPAMTAQVSAAGGQVTGLQRPGKDKTKAKGDAATPATASATAKAPDDAQTARGENAAEAAPDPSVAVAGATAGAGEAAPDAKKKKKRDGKGRGKKGEGEAAKGEGAAAMAGGGGGPVARGGGGGRRKRFGQNLGDRGEPAADEARQRLTTRAQSLRVNEGAGSRIGAARAAAEPAPTAAEADGQRQQAGTLAEATITSPDAAGAAQRAQSALASVAPTTIEELDNFAGPGGAGTRDQLAQSIAADAGQQAAPVRDSMSQVGAPPMGAEPPAAVPQPEPMGAPGSADPALAAAAPPPVPEESLDASEFKEDADQALSEHDVDDATLTRADEGPLHAIGEDKKELNENVDGASTEARMTESGATAEAQGGLTATESESVGTMTGQRHASQGAVSAEQTGTRGGEETGQRTLAEQISGIYATAEGQVNDKLASLQNDAVQSFRERQGQRLEAFAAGVRAELDAFKSRRYRGLRGLYYRGRDWVLSINSLSEVKALYDRNRSAYIADIDALLVEIKDGIQKTIDGCKTTLAEAKASIDQLVSDNHGKLDTDAQAALERARNQFAAMEQRIETTRRSALAALDRERDRAIREMDAKLAEIQAENAGLVDRIAAAIKALAELLGKFMRLLARVTRMGIGAFLSAAGSQAKEGVRNNLWDSLKEAFKEWFFNKVPGLQLLMNLPPNWVEMLTTLASSMIGLITENLPLMLPAIGVAAMTWMATQLALKLIPGAGAIMAVIDAIKAAWALVQSLFSAASAFFEFVMQVAAPGNGAAAFARALAHGIVAAVDMVLTFLGIDALIGRIIGAIARPFKGIIARIQQRFRAFMSRRRQRSERRRGGDKRRRRRDDGDDRGGNANDRRRARAQADRDRHESDRRKRDRERSEDPRKKRETDAERRRKREEDEARRRRERRDEAVRAIGPPLGSLLSKGVSRLRLGVQLGLWRLRHRLRKLSLEDSRVVAGNSDDVTVRQVLRDNPEAVRRMVHDIGKRRFQQSKGRVGAGGPPHSVPAGGQPEDLGANLDMRPVVPGKPGRLQGKAPIPIQVGGTAVGAHQQPGLLGSDAARRNIFIDDIGRYPEIGEALTKAGMSGPQAAEALMAAAKPGGPGAQAPLFALLFGREVLQSSNASATSPLALHLMQQGVAPATLFGNKASPSVAANLFPAEKLNPELGSTGWQPGGNIFPPSMLKAAEAGRNADTVATGGSLNLNTVPGQLGQAYMMREIEMVYLAVRNMEFSDTAGLQREIERLFDMISKSQVIQP
ncbi:eCIS core domain-containing protein [Paracoccus sp. KR1-242]|uniref:eCIS core domain-containing protein n=1 Tax=Paracoccus sp. KR1-242 TaxID=3410028 RepID=UPI003C043688